MRVTAKVQINHNGVWHKAGESFEINEAELAAIEDVVTTEYVSEVFPPEQEEPQKRVRRRKTEE